jgi:transposase
MVFGARAKSSAKEGEGRRASAPMGLQRECPIFEGTLQAGETVCGIARRHGVVRSRLFTWRRQAPGSLGRRSRARSSSCHDRFYAGAGIDGRSSPFSTES